MLFAGLLSIFQNLTMAKAEKEKMKSELTEEANTGQWTIWTGMNGLKIFQKFEGEIRFGPAYLTLKSEPAIKDLDDKTFGDWFFQYKNGLLLQKWNSTETPDTDLIFIDTDTFQAQTIEKNIPSVLWDIVETTNNTLQLNCDTGREILTYKIEI